jgi:uncharacterized SAM-binding protein YcdF (DUF218 family)
MAWTLGVKKLILPPAGPLIVAAAGVALAVFGHQRLGLALTIVGLAALYLASAPWLARWLLRSLDRGDVLDPDSPEARAAGAIVILDAGRHGATPERGGDRVSPATLERLAAGAEVYRRLELPVLVSGDGARELMADELDRAFGVPVRWIEPDSRNTHENAQRSARLLRDAGVDRVVLVTHFWHLPRAVAAFRHAGLEPLPAPTGFADRLRSESGLMMLVPSARALLSSYLALHEWMGIVWYRIRYRHGS